MLVHDCEQRSEQWFRLRLGIPTASEFCRIVTPKGKLSKQSEGYLHRLLAEWVIGAPLEDPTTQWMQRGSDLEQMAAEAYSFEKNAELQRVGFITTDNGMIGASLDRLVAGQSAAVELKCPSAPVHIGHMIQRRIDDEHKPQVQGQILVAELDYVDVQSFFPGLPTVIIRAHRDEPYLAELKTALECFVDVMLKARVQLEQAYGSFKPRPTPRAAEPLGITDEDLDFILAARRAGS